jgi:hypothetical protein
MRWTELENGFRMLYSIIKISIGVVCLILAAEYGWTYIVYEAATYRILYVADLITWLFAGLILFSEGMQGYIRAILEGSKKRIRRVRREAEEAQRATA